MRTRPVLEILRSDTVKKYTGGHCAYLGGAFIRGIPQQLENLNVAMGEFAVFSTLLMTVQAAGFIGGYAPPFSTYEDLRSYYAFFWWMGLLGGICELAVSTVLRIVSLLLVWESGMLVVLSKCRFVVMKNLLFFTSLRSAW